MQYHFLNALTSIGDTNDESTLINIKINSGHRASLYFHTYTITLDEEKSQILIKK